MPYMSKYYMYMCYVRMNLYIMKHLFTLVYRTYLHYKVLSYAAQQTQAMSLLETTQFRVGK
jgi:hypothetical protein